MLVLEVIDDNHLKMFYDEINHSFIDGTGLVRSLKEGFAKEYSYESVFRERIFFTCAVDGI
jgi:hypothetical protein